MSFQEPVIVVGASIAGLHAARLIAGAGREVVVLERMRSLDQQPRALIVTSTMLDILGPVGQASVTNEVYGYELIAGGRTLSGTFARPDLIIERTGLIRSLAKDALASGARIEYGARVVGFSDDASSPGVFVRGGERSSASEPASEDDFIRAHKVIVANGSVGTLVKARPQPLVPLIQALVELPADLPSDRFRVWFSPEDTPYFLWLIPDGPSTGALGIIGEDGPTARLVLDRFVAEQGLRAREYQAARIPMYARWIDPVRRIGGVDVVLAGDAAGHVKVSTVGGVVTGLVGAEAAAASVLGLPDASRRWRALRSELGAHRLARRAVHALDVPGYERLFDAAAPALASLGAVDRDHAVRLMARSLVRHPRLLAAGVGALARSRRVTTGG